MLNGGVRTRRSAGSASPVGTPVAGSSANPGSATGTLKTRNVTITDAIARMAAVTVAACGRRTRVAIAMAIADAAAKPTTIGTTPADTGSPSFARASAERIEKRPPAKTLNATK
jgi:hypothetical protein